LKDIIDLRLKPQKIQKIQDADKIAAGEVVERPANVVKELIENSIDANSKEIRVIVKKAGKNLIQVIDNGNGITPEDIVFAFERHTSSKIRSIKDLENLSTLGFRGEALASIAAVSQVEIISRTKENERGVQLIIEGGLVLTKKEISSPVGTNIKIKNLFYNIPARQKFLKKDPTELGHITDIIQRYSLAYPNLHFIYIHNELSILNCPASNDLKTTVFHIYGKKTAKFMEPVDFKEVDFKLKGLLGHSEISRNSRSHSSIFLNQRYIISDLLFRAVQEAYKGILMIGKYAFFILYLELDPSVVDFNIHPKKLYVRFEDEDYIYNKIYNIVRGFVEENFIEKEDKYTISEINQFVSKSLEDVEEENQLASENYEYSVASREEEKLIDESVQLHLTDHMERKRTEGDKLPETFLREHYIITKSLPKLRLVSHTGQLSNNIYIVLEGINENGEAGLYLLDQHAASERIKKEFFYNLYNKSKKSRQKLISPLKIDISPSETFFLQSNLIEIKNLGFNFEHFRGNSFILREIPTIIDKLPSVEIIEEIINDITEIGKDRTFSEVKEQIINYLACHKSIRGGDALSLKDIRKLIIDLSNCRDPFHCAHGRPTLKFISFKELDKLFKRTV